MKLSGFLNKPRWQAKEPAVRRAGVAGDDDAELLASLAGIARQDPDPGVRSAAMKRLADPAVTQRVAQEDADPGVRADARRLWFDLLAGTHAQSPSPVECTRLLRAQDDAALIEHVARSAADQRLRAAALERVTRTALLAERVAADPAFELRLAALQRIDDESLLERLAERTRKTDKRISRHAKERADSLRIARGDSSAVEMRARALCERLERLAHEAHVTEEAAEIESQWNLLDAQAGDSLRARYRAARALLTASRERPLPSPPAEPVQVAESESAPVVEDTAEAQLSSTESASEPAAEEPAAPVESEPESTQAVEPPHSQTELDVASASRNEAHERRQAKFAEIESAVQAFESAVEAGIVARAHAAHAELVALRKANAAPLPRAVQRQLAEAERQYAELSRWQHWSDNQRRRQLCESIEALGGSGMHPDAIATRVREAQAEWSRLDVAEGHASDGHAMHGWARRFHAACRHALEPAKSYFRKRQELRKTHSQAITTTLEQVRAIPDDCSDWPMIAKTRHAVVDALRALDGVDPHERKVFARNLKTALGALDARLAGHHDEIQSAKAALIAEAQALGAEPPRGAASAARALQQRWRDVGNGRRDRDQAQWKAFRAALDAVFGKLDAERSERVTRDSESRHRAMSLCAELEALGQGDSTPQRSAVARIENDWESLRVREESLQRRFRAAQATLRDAGMRHERIARRGPYETWLARYRLCLAAESRSMPSEDLRAAWDAAALGDIAAAALASRFEAALQRDGESETGEADDEALREILIRLEIFAGLESPHEDHDRRRELQIERLSARMRGEAATTPHQQLAALLTRWTEQDALPSSELDARLQRALTAALETLP